ncbi:MAG: alpha/beta hydrolase [Pirellulales bacterium]|nr:alpha/beta hydrolase [Pirellulales bacterium]
MTRRLAVLLFVALIALFGLTISGAKPSEKETQDTKPSTGHAEWIPMPTMGGKQFWADELFFRSWRIQRNALTNHCRLLDPSNRRHAWGTFDECRAKLDEIKHERKLPPMTGRAVIVLHGLIRSRESMSRLCEYLDQQGGFTVVDVGYPSTRRTIGEHAKSLARIVENLDRIEEINFVGHSMGNIVVRHYLGDQLDPATGRLRERRIKRMVMLGPPNQGSYLAKALADNGAFGAINGTPGQELGADWAVIEKRLAVPPFEFGVIAGGRGDGSGYNPILPDDDDGTVRVASTHLAGEADFIVLPVLHSFMMSDRRVMDCTLRFLQKGRFRPAKLTPRK